MNIEKNTFYDVRKIPGDKMGIRTISDVSVVDSGKVEVTFSDTAKKELPEPIPLPVKNIISAVIINGELVVNYDNAPSHVVGRVNPNFTNIPPVFTGTGLLIDPSNGTFKKLAGVGPTLTVTETEEEYKLSLDLSDVVLPPPPTPGTLTYDLAMSSTWKSTTPYTDASIGATFYIPGTNNFFLWNNYDVSGLDFPSPYPVTFNADRSFELPAGHYYLEFYTQYVVDGVAELQLYDTVNSKVLMTGLGVESLSTANYSVHQCTVMRGEFNLTEPTTLMIRGKASSRFIYFGYTINREGVTHHKACTMLLWKVSDAGINLPRDTPQVDNSWKQLTAVYDPSAIVNSVNETLSTTYNCGSINLFVSAVKVPNGGSYIIPDSARTFVYLAEDNVTRVELKSPVNISSGTRPFGKHSTLGNDGSVYVPAYNANQHVRIIPMPLGGWTRPVVVGGYDYFPRKLALHDPHITVTAPAPATGHATAMSLFQNNKATGQNVEYLSVATATPELSIGLRLPVSLKGLKLSRGSYGAITAANLYSVENSVRTLLTALTLVGNELIAENLTGAPSKDYVIEIVSATGSPGAIQFGCNGIQLIVAELIDTAKSEGVVELIPGAASSTVTAKYEVAQGSPANNEIMFIPVSNFATRGGFEFYDTALSRWRKDTLGLTIDAAVVFSCAICSPLTDYIYIFTRTASADWYVYAPSKNAIKKLPYVPEGVDCVVNGNDGKIYGAIGNSINFTVVDPVRCNTWLLAIPANYEPAAEVVQLVYGYDGKLRVYCYNAAVYTVTLENLTSVNNGVAVPMTSIMVRKSNGDLIAYPVRRVITPSLDITTLRVTKFNSVQNPDAKMQMGPYVN